MSTNQYDQPNFMVDPDVVKRQYEFYRQTLERIRNAVANPALDNYSALEVIDDEAKEALEYDGK